MRLFIIGASGRVGSLLLTQAEARGHVVTAQSRTAGKLIETEARKVAIGLPSDEIFLTREIAGHDAVILTLGVAGIGKTTAFSDMTRAVLRVMQTTGVRRLVAITGVGAGETKGHGGWIYDTIVYPLFTRNRYADKDRQEAMIERSNLDWTIVRPAPFSSRANATPLQVVTEISTELQLRAVTPLEVATFILTILEAGEYIRQKPFIGHA